MTVKDKVGRVRYVAFTVEGRPQRPALQDAVRRAGEAAWGKEAWTAAGVQLTAFDGAQGLFRVKHRSATALRALLPGVGCVPKVTSGTAKGARKATPGLVRGKRR